MHRFEWGSNYAFHNGSVKHAAVLLGVAALAAIGVAVGRSLPERRRARVEVALGWVLVGVWMAGFLFDLANPRASASTTLPLHWCDVCGALAVLVMFKPELRLPRVLLHFWAACFSSFAFALPAIGLGPNFIDFWIYFGTHAAIVFVAIYDVGVRGFVPTRSDLILAGKASIAWTLLLVPINVLLSANYGFVGPDDTNVRRVILAMGSWPWRLVPMAGIALAAMAALTVVENAIAWCVARMKTSRVTIDESIRLPMPAEPSPMSRAA